MDKCIDSRGQEYLDDIFVQISKAMGCETVEQAIKVFRTMMKDMELANPISNNREEDINVLSTSVNPVRLKNNPVILDKEIISFLYERIIGCVS